MTEQKGSGDRPSKIGPYKILDLLGEGGMSIVFLAEQNEPVKRRVALKVLKAGMDTRQILTRFESERQALAVLDHPNIAKVFDGGIAESGRPYFAMEHVRGVPITEYCDDNRLAIRQRLEIFIKVCSAVQHAHLKGLIHRDIKPSNVLVGAVDGRAEPKIIDFGIAKATTIPLVDETAHTRIGQVVGTPRYMSPEQAGRSGVDVDSRTDIYSLGIVLYELLVGTVPNVARNAANASLDEDHPTPSTRLSGLGDTASDVAVSRATDADDLRRQLRGDLDWIVMRAIEHDRARRYETANALAMECRRFLNFEPVIARPPSTGYLLRRFVQRNRLTVVAASIAGLAIAAGAAGAAIGFVRATEAEKLAVEEAQTAVQVSNFLVELFEVSDPSEARGNSVTAREVLDRGSTSIAQELRHQPEVQSTLMLTMGKVYSRLGLFPEALGLLSDSLDVRRGSLPEGREGIAEALYELSYVHTLAGNYGEALTLGTEALELRRAVLGEIHEDVGHALGNLAVLAYYRSEYELSLDLFRQTFDVFRQTLGEDHPDTINTLSSLGSLHWRTGDLAEAERIMRLALEQKRRAVGDDHPETAVMYNNLAILVKDRGDLAAAEPLYLTALRIQQKTLGKHPLVANTMNNIGTFYLTKNDFDNAEAMFYDALDMWADTLGEDNVKVHTAKQNLGRLYLFSDDLSRAEAYLQEALAGRRSTFGDSHEDTASSMMYLSAVYILTNRASEGERLARLALDVYEETLPAGHTRIAAAKIRLGSSLAAAGRFEEAEALMLENYESLAAASPDSIAERRAAFWMARLYDAWGKPQEAARYRR